ncbi:MAG TPA: type II toxin-antitoxin system prevent-host-death family antitoxin [Lacisediminihabitans sp.]|uniref:type II toxin-antitoxin system Phd/YefM family antitoxin n=1 Tax=Lacisediminihabitans sp. TaxID=2787631 RepID=UPI002ED89EB2
MRTLTATEASRSFASILDDAERGETVVITRGGRRIATIAPAQRSNGGEFLGLMESRETDDGFAADVAAAREAVVLDGPVWSED